MRKELILLAMLTACSERDKNYQSDSDPVILQFTNKAGTQYHLPVYVRGEGVFVVGHAGEDRRKLHFYEADGDQFPIKKGDYLVTQSPTDVSNINEIARIDTGTNTVVVMNPSQGTIEGRFDQTHKGKVAIAGIDHEFVVSPAKDSVRFDQNRDGKFDGKQALIITNEGIAISQTTISNTPLLQGIR